MAATDSDTERLAPPEAEAFYRAVLRTLKDAEVPFLVGGAYAFVKYTGIDRRTKDFDLFVMPADVDRAFEVLEAAGYRTDLTFPHWLGKAFKGDLFVDLIFSSGNGSAPVDHLWFDHAEEEDVFGVRVPLAPPEEMIWSKAFVMERERYDGNDVIHTLLVRAESLNWDRVVDRFGANWRVLLSYIVLFGFVYPGERARIPRRVVDELLRRLSVEVAANAPVRKLCNGTILSRQQYLIDVDEWGYLDGRQEPRGNLSPQDIAHWTAAIDRKK
jgi:hypothetical protein